VQLVGSPCSVCGERIVFAPDADGCVVCGTVFHKECVKGGEACPSCGRNVLSEARKREIESAEFSATAKNWGRRAVTFICVGIVVLQSIALVFAWARGQVSPRDGIQLIIVVALAGAVFFGQGWARVYLGIACVVGALASARIAWVAAANGAALLGLTFATMAGLFGVSAGVLLFSERVELFLASRRPAA
jgi:hypothetical protein